MTVNTKATKAITKPSSAEAKERKYQSKKSSPRLAPKYILRLSSWMADERIRKLSLWDVCIPGTHNSASWQLADEHRRRWSSVVFAFLKFILQDVTVFQQLQLGIRFLDLRVCKNIHRKGEPYCAHGGFRTVPYKDVLQQINAFLEIHPSEVILLSVRRDVAYLAGRGCIGVLESDFWVAACLKRWLGPQLDYKITIGELASKKQNVIYFFEERERFLPPISPDAVKKDILHSLQPTLPLIRKPTIRHRTPSTISTGLSLCSTRPTNRTALLRKGSVQIKADAETNDIVLQHYAEGAQDDIMLSKAQATVFDADFLAPSRKRSVVAMLLPPKGKAHDAREKFFLPTKFKSQPQSDNTSSVSQLGSPDASQSQAPTTPESMSDFGREGMLPFARAVLACERIAAEVTSQSDEEVFRPRRQLTKWVRKNVKNYWVNRLESMPEYIYEEVFGPSTAKKRGTTTEDAIVAEQVKELAFFRTNTKIKRRASHPMLHRKRHKLLSTAVTTEVLRNYSPHKMRNRRTHPSWIRRADSVSFVSGSDRRIKPTEKELRHRHRRAIDAATASRKISSADGSEVVYASANAKPSHKKTERQRRKSSSTREMSAHEEENKPHDTTLSNLPAHMTPIADSQQLDKGVQQQKQIETEKRLQLQKIDTFIDAVNEASSAFRAGSVSVIAEEESDGYTSDRSGITAIPAAKAMERLLSQITVPNSEALQKASIEKETFEIDCLNSQQLQQSSTSLQRLPTEAAPHIEAKLLPLSPKLPSHNERERTPSDVSEILNFAKDPQLDFAYDSQKDRTFEQSQQDFFSTTTDTISEKPPGDAIHTSSRRAPGLKTYRVVRRAPQLQTINSVEEIRQASGLSSKASKQRRETILRHRRPKFAEKVVVESVANDAETLELLTPFIAGRTKIVKSWSATTDPNPSLLCKKLLYWVAAEGQARPREPFIIKILAGEVTPPSFDSPEASMDVLRFWTMQGASALVLRNGGLRSAAKETHNRTTSLVSNSDECAEKNSGIVRRPSLVRMQTKLPPKMASTDAYNRLPGSIQRRSRVAASNASQLPFVSKQYLSKKGSIEVRKPLAFTLESDVEGHHSPCHQKINCSIPGSPAVEAGCLDQANIAESGSTDSAKELAVTLLRRINSLHQLLESGGTHHLRERRLKHVNVDTDITEATLVQKLEFEIEILKTQLSILGNKTERRELITKEVDILYHRFRLLMFTAMLGIVCTILPLIRLYF